MRHYTTLLVKLGLALALTTASTGCLATAHGQVRGGMVVYSDPPPARVVVVDENPGYVWVDGQWVWVNGQWAWNDGYWIPERTGYVYVNGYWETHGRNRVWREPYWRRGSGGYVRSNGVYVAPRVRGSVEVHDHSSGGYRGEVRARPAPAPARIQVNDHSRGNGGGRVIIRDHSNHR
jgi:hypothetical protein